jgi:hypothetical protein
MPAIDGNPNDILTIGVAFLYALIRAARHAHSRTIEGFISDLSYGLSLYPMVLLSGAAFSSWATNALMASNKILMSMAGIISLAVIVRRSFEKSRHGHQFSMSRY